MSLEREGFWRGKKKAKRKSNLRINSKEGKQTFPQTNKITANEKISLLRLKSNHRKDFIVTRRNMIATRERRGLSASWLPCGCRGLELSRRDAVRKGRNQTQSLPKTEPERQLWVLQVQVPWKHCSG